MNKAGRFGLYDPIFQPQVWCSRALHYATIPWPYDGKLSCEYGGYSHKHDEGAGPVLWNVFDQTFCVRYADAGALEGLKLYQLKPFWMKALKKELNVVRKRAIRQDKQWAHGKTLIMVHEDSIARTLNRSARVAFHGLTMPAEQTTLVARVAFFQRVVLELHGRLTWLQLRPMLFDLPTVPKTVRIPLMGAVVGCLDVADRFFRVEWHQAPQPQC